jgi:DNA-binding response OmpR family regulator
MKATDTILLVDDDKEVRALFRRTLTGAGYAVSECSDGMEALDRVKEKTPALIILDVDMPRLDGWKTLAQLRKDGYAQPVLMVTHVNDVDSRVHGLDTGADDYLGKPCEPSELLARVRALLRRPAPTPNSSTPLRLGDVVINLEAKTATRDGKPIQLTRTEYALIEVLLHHAGKPVSRELLLERLWGGSSGRSHTVDTHLWRLRKKIGDTRDEPRWIQNLSGIGYMLNVDRRT